MVVVGTTGDPITPLESTKHMADALEQATLVTVHANQHTGYGTNDPFGSQTTFRKRTWNDLIG